MAKYVAKDGDTLDWLCWRHYRQQSGAVEAVLLANPNLADKGLLLQAGDVVKLPELQTAPVEGVVRLWD